jgi:growth hormone-inducible transmembrane protein
MEEGSPVSVGGRAAVWPDSVRQRIHDTYAALGSGIVVTAASAVVCARIPRLAQFAITSPWLTLGTTAGTMFLAMAVPKENKLAKVGAFALFNGAIGMSLAPLALLGGPIIYKAAAYTGAMVGSLSYVAATSPSERFLYLGGPLAMGLGAVVIASLGSMLLPAAGAAASLAYSVSLYGGLALFSGFVLYDTSNVIHRAENAPAGTWDPYNGAFGSWFGGSSCAYSFVSACLQRVSVSTWIPSTFS